MYLIQALGELDKIIEENMNNREAERRARLMKMRDERLPDIKKQFEESQKRNFNSNFAEGGKDAKLVGRKVTSAKVGGARTMTSKTTGGTREAGGKIASNKLSAKNGKVAAARGKSGRTAHKVDAKPAANRKAGLGVSVRKGEMVHHQRMLSQDVNAQATQHIIGIPVNKSRYNGYDGNQVTNAQLRSARPDPEAVRIIPMGGVGEFGIGKNMTIIEYKGEIIIIDMGSLFAGADYPGVNYMVPDIQYLEDNKDKVKAICFTHAHLDHIGACRHLLPKFNHLTPIYATAFTIGMIQKQMSELDDVPELNYQPVDPFKNEIIKVSACAIAFAFSSSG